MSKSAYIFLSFLGLVIIFGFHEADRQLEKAKKSELHNLKKSKEEQLKHGDVVFQTSNSPQSKAIQLATNSKYSHVGIIYKVNGSDFVFEAVQPVRLTPLKEWIARGEEGHYVAKRLKNRDEVFTADKQKKFEEMEKQFIGKSYDLHFEWSNDRLYCSELVWKVYKEALGVELEKPGVLSGFKLSHPLVKAKLKERYGDNIPMNEKMISPAQIYNSDKLEIVRSSN